MISEKRSQAARANGARSRGPITPEGKAISSRNAMRHGLLAKTILLSNENPERFAELFHFHTGRFGPVDDVELSMIEEMVASYWRLRRAMGIETSLLESALANQTSGSGVERTAAAFCEAASSGPFALLHRYATRLDNRYQHALKNLVLMRKFPAAAAPPLPNEPKTPNLCTTEASRPEPPEPADPGDDLPLAPIGALVIS